MVAASLQPQGREQGQSESQLQAQSQPQMEQLPLPPSERDLQVFEEVAVEGASTREVAGRHGVSQTRIVQIRKRVAEWMASMPADPQLTPVQRIKLAADFAELRADHLYGEAMRAWTASTRPQTECRGMPGSETRTVRSQHGDARYLTVAIRIAERQFHLAVIGRKAIAEAEDRVRIEKQREEFDARSAKSLEAASAPAHDYKYHNPLDRDCSIPADSAEDWVLPKEDELDASDWKEGTCDDMETRPREFLAALADSTAPVQPPVTQACFASRRDRGWKLHTHFEVLRGVPTAAVVTDASGKGAASEKAVLRATLQADRTYITDRGYEDFSLFNTIVAAGSSYVCRVRNDHHFTVQRAGELTAEARAAGVLADDLGRMGSPKSQRIEHPDHVQRRVVVRVPEHPKRGGRRRTAATQDLVLITNLLDVPAEVIVLLYRFRWLIELFFRWLKCVLSCQHLLSQSAAGIQTQMYCALIACLLLQLAGGNVKPNQWTYKLLCLYAQGWATEGEVLEHLRERAAADAKKST